MKCGIYTRVSTDNQAEKKFNSCEAQAEKIKSFIRSQENLEIYKIYNDLGYSGASLERPALQGLFKDITEGKIHCVLTYKIDRLTRSPKDFYNLIEFFDKYGVSFISVTENFDTSSPSGRLLRNIMLIFAQFERELTAERTKDKMQQRREKGLWNGGLVPYGYKNIDKKLEIDEKEAEGVRKIFQIFLETQSLAETRRRINQLGYRTKKGNIFCKGSIDNILRNPIYIGKIEHKGKLFDGVHKAIIPEAMFLKVQSLRKVQIRPETKIKRPFLLGGLLKCQECGSVMTPSYTLKQEKKGKRYIYYYRCTKTCKHDWQSCSIKYVNANRVEEFIIAKLTEISKDKSTIEKLVRRINQDEEQRLSPLQEKEKQIQTRINELNTKIKKLVSFLSESDERLFPTVKKELSGLEQEKKILEFDLEGVRLSIQKEKKEKFEAKIVLENLRNFVDRVKEIKDEEKPYLFQYLIKDIVYGKDEIGVNLFYLPNFRANLPAQSQSVGTARATTGGEPISPSFIPSYIGLKNRSKWLPLLDNFQTIPLKFKNEIYHPIQTR